ncbi:MAG: glucose 1-dehydrogenase [Verrucomicrobiota bacterium]|nr:glucose 1-dehydrogenase [Verrucomicrobiota bacterium]
MDSGPAIDPIKPLKNQKAIVTGGSSGIGEACALALGAAGAAVVVNYRTEKEEAERVASVINKGGGEAIAVGADVSREEEVERLFATALEHFGTVDILINNAGMQRDAAFSEMTLDQWSRVIAVNLTGQFLCARAAVREFLRRGVIAGVSRAAGKIIAMSSVHEVIPWAGHVNYAASKGGIMQLTKSMGQELAPKKIRVNSIAPGAIKTPINHEAWETAEAETALLKLIPYGRVGVPDDIARGAVWLASDASDYVTGTTLFIDGGMTLYPGFASGG